MNDLLVFVLILYRFYCSLFRFGGGFFGALIPLDNDGEPLGGALMRLSYLIVFCHKMQDPVKAFPEEGFLHTLGSSTQIKLHLDAVTFLQPPRRLASFEFEVVVARAYLDLDRLGFGCLCPRFGLLGLFLHFVLVFAVVHQFADGGLGHWADLNKVYTLVGCHCQSFCNRKHPEVGTFDVDDANFGRADLFVDSFLQDEYSTTVMPHNTEKRETSQSFRGVYPVHKERGETLAVLLERFRSERSLDVSTKLTYAGRLDPMAEGIVLILAGEDRFQKDALLGLSKIYEVEVLLGVATDTLDPLGVITGTLYKEVISIEPTMEMMKSITTLPYPMYSSVPVDGKPLFAHARAGSTVAVPDKKVTIYSVELLSTTKVPVNTIAQSVIDDVNQVQGDFRQADIIRSWQQLLDQTNEVTIVSIRVHASSGTYMRSLAEWIGEQLGVPALAYRIDRIQIGEYTK